MNRKPITLQTSETKKIKTDITSVFFHTLGSINESQVFYHRLLQTSSNVQTMQDTKENLCPLKLQRKQNISQMRLSNYTITGTDGTLLQLALHQGRMIQILSFSLQRVSSAVVKKKENLSLIRWSL